MRSGEPIEQFIRKKTDGRSHVESKIVFLILDLAGNLYEPVVRIDFDFPAGPLK